MADEVTPEIMALEEQLQSAPDSPPTRERLLWAYSGDPNLHGHPRRIEHILWFVRSVPRDAICRSPMVEVDPAISPEGYEIVEREWLRLLDENPGEPDIARGAAIFISVSDPDRAREILRNVIEESPNQAEVWTDLGRISTDPVDRLESFQEAWIRGSTQPNLLIWIARTALETGDLMTAATMGIELLALVESARAAHGDKLDWKERGKSLWAKAYETTGNSSAASQLVTAISDHAYHKHWGHTILGHVALHQDDLQAATEHLRESAAVVGDSRLSSSGPSFTLAKELCAKAAWSEVAAYLRACESFWDDERLDAWRNQVERHEVPDFPRT